MISQSPKHILKNFQNRNVAIGRERRLNMSKKLLENQPHFPKTLSYEDFDMELFKWVDETFDLVCDGKKFNTYKLFSNQRMTEYGQTWQNLDEKGNLDINFKTITREPNPQKGDIYGGNYNIPSTITFPIFRVKTIDENGVEYVESYSMRQPVAVNLIYTVGIFTNTYKMLNIMNSTMHKEFRGLERYIFPNGFAIPMELNSVSDESEYTIDDRKYYCQTFQIKVLAYIINESDYVVTKVPYRARVQFHSGINSSNRENNNGFMLETTITEPIQVESGVCETHVELVQPSDVVDMDEVMNETTDKTILEIEELCGKQVCWEGTDDEFYVDKKIVYVASIDYCYPTCVFENDYHLGIESIVLENVKDYTISVNDIEIDVENSDIELLKGDIIKIEITVINEKKDGIVKILCQDLDSIIGGEEQETSIINV